MLTTTASPTLSPRPSVAFRNRSGKSPYHNSPPVDISSYSPRARPSASPTLSSRGSLTVTTLSSPRHRPRRSPGGPSGTVLTVDVGTQYTPDGLPPTARKHSASHGPTISISPSPAHSTTSRSSPISSIPRSAGGVGAIAGAGKRSSDDLSQDHEASSRDGRGPATTEPPAEPSRRASPSQAPPEGGSATLATNGENGVPHTEPTQATSGTAPSAAAAIASSRPPTDAEPDGHEAKRVRSAAKNLKVMPRRYEEASMQDLGKLVAEMLMELVRLNDSIPLKDGMLTRFHSRAPPGISVTDYLFRLIIHATLSPPLVLSMVYYIDRLCALFPGFTISSLTVHRFLIAAATVASKGLSDTFWTNSTYARVGGVSIKELALLELDLLERLDWKIVPKPEVLVDYYCSLVERADGYVLEEAGRESSKGPSPPAAQPSPVEESG